MLRFDTNSSEPAALELSIVMPCLNEARTVGTCVRKALDYLDQHHVKGEVMVAHNGRTDGSQAGQALVAAGLSAGRTRWGGERGATTGRRAAMGVRPLHSIGEVAEGNEAMEKRGWQEGITMEQAKGQTQRWQPLLPNLRRVNEAAIAPPPVLPEEPAAVTPHGGFGETKPAMAVRYPINLHVRFDERSVETEPGSNQ